MPAGADLFFQKLMRSHFKFLGEVSKDTAFWDIRNILNKEFSQEIKAELLYNQWLEDMADVCKTFCELEKIENFGKTFYQLTIETVKGFLKAVSYTHLTLPTILLV